MKQLLHRATIVSRETREGFLNQIETMFHVKHGVRLLLPDAEFAEDDVQDVFDINPTEQATE